MVVITMLFAFTTSVHAGQDILETEKYVIHVCNLHVTIIEPKTNLPLLGNCRILITVNV